MDDYTEKFSKLSLDELNDQLLLACSNGNIEIIQYLITSKDLEKNPSIYYKEGEPVLAAVLKNQIEVLKYLLTSPNLSKKLDVHAYEDALFISSCSLKKYNIVKYLIEDFKIEETENIKNFLKMYKDSIPSKMFLNRNLATDLSDNSPKEKKLKL